jgi:hypothetical protein
MAKFDIKDGFWRLNCAEGEEWNFSYVLPQPPGEPTRLVVPSSLQMGWVESPAYFCVASETARDVASWYIGSGLARESDHKFLHHAMDGDEVAHLPLKTPGAELKYFLDVYVDDFIPMAIATSKEQLAHVANAVLHGIHAVFPADAQPEADPVSYKKLLKHDGQLALHKDLLGFTFNGAPGGKTMQLEHPKREFLLAILHKWIRASARTNAGILFLEFESVISKIRHAFMSIQCGRGLLTPCNKVLSLRPPVVYLHRNLAL